MDSAIAGLIGAVIGAFVVIVNTFISNYGQLRLEQIRAKLTKQAKIEEELRANIAQVSQLMLTAQHSMEWICWHADHDLKSVTSELINNYHREIHDVFPKILGVLAVISSIDNNIYIRLSDLAEKVYNGDGQIAGALKYYRDDPMRTCLKLSEIHPIVFDLYKVLPQDLANIMRSVDFTKKVVDPN